MVRFPNGKEVPYWNTFYQEVKVSTESTHKILWMLREFSLERQKYVAESINEKTASGKKSKNLFYPKIADGVNVEEKQVVRAIKKAE